MWMEVYETPSCVDLIKNKYIKCHDAPPRTDLPVVLGVVDLILLQNAPPYFHHPLHLKRGGGIC